MDCEFCGMTRGTCPEGTKWPDGKLCAFRPYDGSDVDLDVGNLDVGNLLYDLHASAELAARQSGDVIRELELSEGRKP